MGGNAMSSGTGPGQYELTVSTSNNKLGTLKLYNITGDVVITAKASR